MMKNKADGAVETVCNKCGGTCAKFWADGEFEDYGLVNAKVSSGYLSHDLEDGNLYTFSLCEKCLKEMFESFKIPVKTLCYLFPEESCSKDYSNPLVNKIFRAADDNWYLELVESEENSKFYGAWLNNTGALDHYLTKVNDDWLTVCILPYDISQKPKDVPENVIEIEKKVVWLVK